ncbi:MAG: lipocalin-like domain-containing protein [Gammaproteobacteria bacterium]
MRIALVTATAIVGALAIGGAPASSGATSDSAAPSYAIVTSNKPLMFPADYGSHPQFRTEWWYVTGWLRTEHGESLGFQITFFRTKPGIDDGNPSAFAAHQLLIAHSAISDLKRGRLWQDQRIRRAGLGLAEAATGDTDVHIDGWSLRRDAAGGQAGNSPGYSTSNWAKRLSTYSAKIEADDFTFALTLAETQAVLLNGDAGFSRKGPAASAASYYYSLPHLRVTGAIERKGSGDRVSGEAWLDHEWSSEYLDTESVGWDWIGINLDDGAALMAFRIRGPRDESRWSGGTLRSKDGQVQVLGAGDVEFRAGRRWTSPRTQITYPVQWRVRAGNREFELQPLIDDQENDTRLSTGAIYWEGAVRAYEKRLPVGRGYLELTGYGERLRLR